ncbi:2115_t:CDS:2, partial [Gigaspora rosea]
DQPVPFLEGVHNIPFAEYSDGDDLAAIWANINVTNNQQNYGNEDLWTSVSVANNHQICDRDDLISMNTFHNNYNILIIARENYSNTVLDNFMTVEDDHINAIQGNLDNLTNVEDYLAAIYDDSIDVAHLAAIYDDPMGVEHLTTTYDNPTDVEEDCLATIYDISTDVKEEHLATDTTDIEKNIPQNDNINLIEELNINQFEVNNIGIICHRTEVLVISSCRPTAATNITSFTKRIIDSSRQHNWLSRKIKCPWHINLNMTKLSTEIRVNSLVNQHNHVLLPNTALYDSKFRKLSNKIMEKIKFYVTKGNMGSKQIYSLLVASFPEQVICKKDLYNAIQKFKAPYTQRQGNAQHIINKLLILKDQEPGWIINTRLDPFDN